MAIAIASTLSIHVGGRPLFDDVSFKLEAGDRMTLAGRNGAGKSTLLRILAGELSPDAGELTLRKGTRIALHDQRPAACVRGLTGRLRDLRSRRDVRGRGGTRQGRGGDGLR